MNRKGFTLIELLAVVVILLAITVIAIASISSVIERNKAKQNETKKDVIIGYAKLFYEQNKYGVIDLSEIYLSELGLSDEEMRDANGDYFCGYVKVNSATDFEFIEDSSRCGVVRDE